MNLLAMHIPDGLLDGPVLLATGLASLAAVAWGCRKLRGDLGDRMAPFIGVMAAGVFAMQMVDFPVLGTQVSGHVIGSVLAAVVLGPWGALLAITCVLMVQCLVFADGGLLALGANIFNMGVIGCLLGYGAFDFVRSSIGGYRGTIAGAAIAAWLVIPVSALAGSVELAASGTLPFVPTATAMIFAHALIGIAEAVLTGLTVAWLLKTRPELIYQNAVPTNVGMRLAQTVVVGLVMSLSVAAFASPWASELKDTLDTVSENRADDRELPAATAFASLAPLPDYAWPSREEKAEQGRAGGSRGAEQREAADQRGAGEGSSATGSQNSHDAVGERDAGNSSSTGASAAKSSSSQASAVESSDADSSLPAESAFWHSAKVATGVIGVLGTSLTFGVGLLFAGLARVGSSRSRAHAS